MKNANLLLSKLEWPVVGALPLYPNDRLVALQDRLGCALDSPCFVHGLPFRMEGIMAGPATGVVLWPMCVWQLGGRWLRQRSFGGSKAS